MDSPLASLALSFPLADAVPISGNVPQFNPAAGFIGLVFYVIVAVALWKVFTKAGYPGILGIIPFVNVVFLVKIAGFSGWLALLYIVPIANIVLGIIVALRVGKAFGKGGVFSIFLLWIFPIIGFLILGFGDARYTKPA